MAVSAKRCWRAEHDGSVALVNNVMDGLPEDFDPCDVLYAEPAWRHGFEKFNRRAGLKEPAYTYEEYVSAIGKIVTEAGKPAVIITGLHARRRFPAANQWINVVLNGHKALALTYDVTLEGLEGETTHHLISRLAERFERVGDFCCGYGNTGRIFVGAGKKCVLSDHNPMCVGHIDRHWRDW